MSLSAALPLELQLFSALSRGRNVQRLTF